LFLASGFDAGGACGVTVSSGLVVGLARRDLSHLPVPPRRFAALPTRSRARGLPPPPGLLCRPRACGIRPAPPPSPASASPSLPLIAVPPSRWLSGELGVPRFPPFRLWGAHDVDHPCRAAAPSSPWGPPASSPPCRPHTPWSEGVEPYAFAAIGQARPCPILGRPVPLGDGSPRLRPGGSPQALQIPPRGGHPALRSPARGGSRAPLAVSRFGRRARGGCSLPASLAGR
jgi:hypothetical protein